MDFYSLRSINQTSPNKVKHKHSHTHTHHPLLEPEGRFNVKSSSSSCFYSADAVASARSNGRLSQTASYLPTILCSQHLILQSRHTEEDYVTVGGVRALAPTATPLSSFFPPQLLGVSEVFSFFLCALVSGVSLAFVSTPWRASYLSGENFSTKERGGEERTAWHPSSCWPERPVAAAAGPRSKVKANLPLVNTLRQTLRRERRWEVSTSAGMSA